LFSNFTGSSLGIFAGSSGEIIFYFPGTYNIQLIAQLTAIVTATATIDLWYSQGGSSVSKSNTQTSLTSAPKQITNISIVTITSAQISAGTNYVQFYWSASNMTGGSPSVTISSVAASGSIPASPSLNLQITQVTSNALPIGINYGDYLYYSPTLSNWVTGDSYVVMGGNAGLTGQASNAIAIGSNSGNYQQGAFSIAIGNNAGQSNQSVGSISIGSFAGSSSHGTGAISLGTYSGSTSQGSNSIAIGSYAGAQNQGNYSIALGFNAGKTNQSANSIVLNASGLLGPSAATSGFFVNPVSTATSANSASYGLMMYDTTQNQILYSPTLGASTSKTFVIDHPNDKQRYLVHGCLEGPEAGVYYRGKGTVSNGKATIVLPKYTSAFKDFTVHVTCVGQPIPLGVSEVINGVFEVYASKNTSFNWVVYATRSTIEVEPLKIETKVSGSGPYLWIN
jgi:hypothetical protein